MSYIKSLLIYQNCYFFLVGFVLIAVGMIAHGAPYVPPLGIPAPEFGIDEKSADFYIKPSPWNQEVPNWYYVDQYHPNASDKNSYGTPDNPRATIPDPIPAGSVVELNGTYDFAPTGYDLITSNGTEAAPVFIIGSGSATVTQKWVLKASYTIIENIEFTSRGKVSVVYPSHHLSIRNNNLHHMAGKIGGYGNSDSERIRHIVIYNNQIHSQDGWDQNPSVDLDNHGIKFGRYVEDIWVLDNLAYNNGGNFIQVGDWNSPANNQLVRRYYIGRNTAYANRQSAIGIKQSSDVIISENHLYNNVAIQDNAAGQAGVVFQYGPGNLWIIFNRIYASNAGISSGSNSGGVGREQYIVGNLIYDIHTADDYAYNSASAWSPAAIMLAGGVNRYVVDNTIYNADAGINCPGSGSLNITGNVITNITKANHIFVELGATASASRVHNNLIYQNRTSAKIRWGGAPAVDVAIFELSNPTVSSNNIEADPEFADAVNNNFRLLSFSPAIDSGIESGVYQTFFDRYGIDISQDAIRVARPQGVMWDIGAREYDANLPAAPSSLSAIAMSSNQIDLNWIDNSNHEDGFIIQYSTDGTNYSELVSLGAGVTSYSINGLKEATTYYYRLYSYNNSGNSTYSNPVSVTTLNQTIADTIAPTIFLIGENPQVITIGSAYTELGATASDNVDGDISSRIDIDASAVNTSLGGSYRVTYNVQDAAGNRAREVVRTVNVVTKMQSSPVSQASGGGAFWLSIFILTLSVVRRWRPGSNIGRL